MCITYFSDNSLQYSSMPASNTTFVLSYKYGLPIHINSYIALVNHSFYSMQISLSFLFQKMLMQLARLPYLKQYSLFPVLKEAENYR